MAAYEGLTPFVSVQSHYNLIMREDERELMGLCREDNIAITPYSALASGRLARLGTSETQRFIEDSFAKGKYDNTMAQDTPIIQRVAELADKHHVSMTEISLAWLLTKVTAPVVGASKKQHIDAAIQFVTLSLSSEEVHYLEACYQPHSLSGIMAQQRP